MSNNFIKYITVDKKEYKSVTHYVYSNIVCDNTFKKVVKTQTTGELAKNTAIELYNKCNEKTVIHSIDKALVYKFSNQTLRTKLLNTGDSVLQYMTKNNPIPLAPI